MSRRDFQRRQDREDRRENRRSKRNERTQRRDASIEARNSQSLARKRRSLMMRILMIGLGVIVVGAIIWFAMAEILKPQPGERLADLGNLHIASVDTEHEPYNSTPPTSGPHIGNITPAQIYEAQIPDEVQVHNLEDGFVIFHYNCPDGCDELVQQLTGIVQGYLDDGRRVFMEPYADMDTRIALTAWTRLEAFEDFDEARIRTFVDAYEGVDHHIRQ